MYDRKTPNGSYVYCGYSRDWLVFYGQIITFYRVFIACSIDARRKRVDNLVPIYK